MGRLRRPAGPPHRVRHGEASRRLRDAGPMGTCAAARLEPRTKGLIMIEPEDNIQNAVPPEYQEDYIAPPSAPHGTRNCYQNHMCRCSRCRRAQADYMENYRATRAARRIRPPQARRRTAA